MAKKTKSDHSSLFNKRYIKLLSVSQNPAIVKKLVNTATVPILKLICNSAIHASKGNINLSTNQKKLFRKNKRLFATLTNKQVSFNRKRAALSQKGGSLAFLPTLLSTVLSILGPALFRSN